MQSALLIISELLAYTAGIKMQLASCYANIRKQFLTGIATIDASSEVTFANASWCPQALGPLSAWQKQIVPWRPAPTSMSSPTEQLYPTATE